MFSRLTFHASTTTAVNHGGQTSGRVKTNREAMDGIFMRDMQNSSAYTPSIFGRLRDQPWWCCMWLGREEPLSASRLNQQANQTRLASRRKHLALP